VEVIALKMPITRINRWHYRVDKRTVGCCALETWITDRNDFCVLVTELGDNPGPSITNSHEQLRRELEKWLCLENRTYRFFERYVATSYIPPRENDDEICEVTNVDERFRWRFVPEDEWAEIYHPVSQKIIRKPRKTKELD
jgi:hypothetical protein